APREKTRTRIEIDVRYFASMMVHRLYRLRGIGSARPLGGPSWRFVPALLFLSASAFGVPLVPTNPGTTWRYRMTEELGKGLTISNLKPDAYGKVRLPVLYRLEGLEDVDGKRLLKFEMHRAGSITNTDLVTVDEHGIICWARINLDGELIKFNPPQIMVAAPLKQGATWNFDGQAGDLRVHQEYNVTGEEDIEVPAAEFHAFHIRGEQSSPSRMTIDRWFVPGTGIVKDVTTMRAADGDLLERISLELTERPQIENRPEVKSEATSKRLSVTFANDQFGKPTTTFSSDTPQIYVRWQGRRLRKGGKVKAVWIAENIGEDFPQGYKVDEATATVESQNARGAFTLARPEDGWAVGDYRVEFYVDDVFVDAPKLKIVK
ncbi:MAG TPA: hypothetical protein VEU75_04180, partial [Candidatus Acidoferrum sp.]|nr:hypothetical protein [Candidatus Acidoferrum sp.]